MKYAMFLGAIAVLAMCSFANATMVSYQDVITTTNVGFGTTCSLPQFDPSLGTLTAVELDLCVTFSGGVIEWDNEAGVSSSVALGIGAEVTATGPGALALVATPLQTDNGTVEADEAGDGAGDYDGPDAFSVSTGSGYDTDTDNPDSFAAYLGTGNVTIDVTSLTKTYLSTSGGYGPINTCDLGSYCGYVNVTYTYVPEPATMSLLAIGGVAVLVRRRRK